MKPFKHSKYKNTGVLFELLVRQVASDTLNNVDSKALPMIKKYFSKYTELAKELNLYQSLVKEKFAKQDKAGHLIDAIITSKTKLNQAALNRQKYNLIKEIKDAYVLEDFFNAKVSNYKVLASAYKLFEYTVADNPVDLVNSRYTLIEHITHKPVVAKAAINEKNAFTAQDKDVRLLSYKILVDKFNAKYSGLNSGQKRLLKEYINSVSENVELKEFILNEVNILRKDLKELASKVTDKVVKIKLAEVTSLLKKITEAKTIKDGHLISLLRYHELVKELKKV